VSTWHSEQVTLKPGGFGMHVVQMGRILAWAVLLGACAGASSAQSGEPSLQPVDGPGVLKHVRESKARFVLVNVWATWCGPCREEFPELLQFARAHQKEGLELMLVSADFVEESAEAVAFLKSQGVTWPSWIQSGAEHAFVEALHPAWSGALPATFLFDRGTQVGFWQGRIRLEELEQALAYRRKTSEHSPQERSK
jgi:thiol-disulfide isomerase/thioredoxin